MQDEIEFKFIYARDAVKVKSFLKNIPGDVECINYMDIYNKLSKNDYFQIEPSNIVISSYLAKQLNNALIKNNSKNIYYVLEELESNIIIRIKTYIKSLTTSPINFHLIVSEEMLGDVTKIEKDNFESIDELIVY